MKYIFLFLFIGCISYPIGKVPEMHINPISNQRLENIKFTKKGRIEKCNWFPIFYPMWAKPNLKKILPELCSDGAVIKNITYNEQFSWSFFYNKVCHVVEGDCYE